MTKHILKPGLAFYNISDFDIIEFWYKNSLLKYMKWLNDWIVVLEYLSVLCNFLSLVEEPNMEYFTVIGCLLMTSVPVLPKEGMYLYCFPRNCVNNT